MFSTGSNIITPIWSPDVIKILLTIQHHIALQV